MQAADLTRSEALLAGLNPPQLEAVTCPGGPLLVLAGAGSGKTRVLTHRLAYLVETGQAGLGEILAVTFTNKAAAEMRERVSDLLQRSAAGLWVSTFHSACVRILRSDADKLGFTRSFTIYDSDDSKRLIKRCANEAGVDTKRFTPSAVQNRISDHKNRLRDPEKALELAHGPYDTSIADIYARYQQALAASNAMDFDDLLARTVDLFERFPEVLARYRNTFRQIMVDEYQDTNPTQYRLLQLLSSSDDPDAPRNLMVVGDDAQSIYGFRSADISNILDFEKDFVDAKVVRLEQNYRSTGHILAAANGLISNNTRQLEKSLWTAAGDGEPVKIRRLDSDLDESRWLVNEIEDLIADGTSAAEIAVLYRVSAQSRPIETALAGAEIPYKVIGSVRFFERAEIKDALAYLSLILNPFDQVAFSRIVNRPRRGIGATSLARLLTYADSVGDSPTAILKSGQAAGLKAAAARAAEQFSGELQQIYELLQEQPKVADLLSEILKVTGYRQALELSGTVEDEGRIENLDQLISAAAEFDEVFEGAGGVQAAADFLQQIALAGAADHGQEGEYQAKVTMMTLHNAKGLEFKAVFLVGMEDGLFPHSRAIDSGELDEERRLAYVGITRARERLAISWAARRALYGPPVGQFPSRFLREIPAGNLDQDSTFSISAQATNSYSTDRRDRAWLVPGSKPAWSSASSTRTTGEGEQPNRDTGSMSLSQMGVVRGSQLGSSGVKTNESLDLPDAGSRVKHLKFGQGTVKSLDADVIIVDFDATGERRLIAGFARLEKL